VQVCKARQFLYVQIKIETLYFNHTLYTTTPTISPSITTRLATHS